MRFPAKPLGCYGDGGAVFTDDDEMFAILKSLRVHGQGADKYDNIRIGMNGGYSSSRRASDTIPLREQCDKIKVLPSSELFARIIRRVYVYESISQLFLV